MEEKVSEYKKIQEESHTLNSNSEVVVGGDETFFENIILVLMDIELSGSSLKCRNCHCIGDVDRLLP